MTLCIAALCSIDGVAAATHAVVSCDSRIETDSVGADLYFKIQPLTDRWSVLFAGEEDEHNELIAEYRKTLKKQEDTLNESNARTILIGPANIVRERRAESVTQKHLAMDYKCFLANGKQYLPDDIHKQLLNEIMRQEIGADLLLVGPIGEEMAVFRYDGEEHRISRVYDFAAIGSGYQSAEPVFFQRSHDQFERLPRTIYVVYEAQKAGQSAPGVGQDMTLIVIDGQGGWQQVSWKGLDRLAALYEHHFGPRDLYESQTSGSQALDLTASFFPDDFFNADDSEGQDA